MRGVSFLCLRLSLYALMRVVRVKPHPYFFASPLHERKFFLASLTQIYISAYNIFFLQRGTTCVPAHAGTRTCALTHIFAEGDGRSLSKGPDP